MSESSDTQSAHVSDTLDFAYRLRNVPETMAPVEINTEYGEMTTMEESYREYLAIMERKPEPPEILSLPFETSFESNGARVGGFSVRTDSKRGKMCSVHWEWPDAEILGGWVEFEQWPGGLQRGETSKNICAHYIIDAETGYGFQSTDDGLRKIRLRSNERVSDIQPVTSLPFDVVPLKLPESHVFFSPTDPDKEENHIDGEWYVVPSKKQAFRDRDDAWAVWCHGERAREDGTHQQFMTLLSGNDLKSPTNQFQCEFPAGLTNGSRVETTTGFFKPNGSGAEWATLFRKAIALQTKSASMADTSS